ncbi:expressed protein [Echinococcus multilocularis]|uniref:Expressed protein n=1 Tax=Echinococcus multilocularis TaxID=6211 RepID=A0A068Y5W8_ECHMU|nr:expressed protein [Echinococcus multilocularis]
MSLTADEILPATTLGTSTQENSRAQGNYSGNQTGFSYQRGIILYNSTHTWHKLQWVSVILLEDVAGMVECVKYLLHSQNIGSSTEVQTQVIAISNFHDLIGRTFHGILKTRVNNIQFRGIFHAIRQFLRQLHRLSKVQFNVT